MGRIPRLLIFVLLVLDCLANAILVDGSWRNTLSGDAWKHRDHAYWGWCWKFIDSLFYRLPYVGGPDHCQRAAEREEKYGSAWTAWAADFKAAPWWATAA